MTKLNSNYENMKSPNFGVDPCVGTKVCVQKNGASEEIRTLDINLGKVALYQLSYTRSRKRVRVL